MQGALLSEPMYKGGWLCAVRATPTSESTSSEPTSATDRLLANDGYGSLCFLVGVVQAYSAMHDRSGYPVQIFSCHGPRHFFNRGVGAHLDIRVYMLYV